MTTKQTIKERMAGFPLDLLPEIYQNAISVTRELGVRYLWIDALCIIQDDSSDWECEASNMRFVYGGALLTISATKSPDLNEGFLGPRAKLQTHHEIKTQDNHTVFVRNRMKHSIIIPSDGSTSGCPLLTRGWVFQERLLSTRTLHFLPDELLWECRCRFWCECTGVEADLYFKTGSFQASQFSMALAQQDKDEIPTLWLVLMQEYTKRLLTVSTDRLPALSGIAHLFHEFGVGEYFAGLWGGHFYDYLLWQADHSIIFNSNELASRSAFAQNTSPSWSWTSSCLPAKWPVRETSRPLDERFIEQRFKYNPEKTFPMEQLGMGGPFTEATIFRIETTLAGQDPFGAVTSGTVYLCARMTSVMIKARTGSIYELSKGHDQMGGIVKLTPDFDPTTSHLKVGDLIFLVFMVHKSKSHGWDDWTALALVSAAQKACIKDGEDTKVMEVDEKMIEIKYKSDVPLGSYLKRFHGWKQPSRNYSPYPEEPLKIDCYQRIGLVEGRSPRRTHMDAPQWFYGVASQMIAII